MNLGNWESGILHLMMDTVFGQDTWQNISGHIRCQYFLTITSVASMTSLVRIVRDMMWIRRTAKYMWMAFTHEWTMGRAGNQKGTSWHVAAEKVRTDCARMAALLALIYKPRNHNERPDAIRRQFKRIIGRWRGMLSFRRVYMDAVTVFGASNLGNDSHVSYISLTDIWRAAATHSPPARQPWAFQHAFLF